MAVLQSFDESIASAADEEDVSMAEATTVGRGGGQAAERGSGRGRGQRSAPPVHLGLSLEDSTRMQSQGAQMITNTETRIQRLNLEQSHHLLQLCLSLDPSMMFDLLALEDHPPAPPASGQPEWCVCRNCREMPTVLERKCCGQHPDACISRQPEMDVYIVQPGTLRLARRIWNDVRAQVDPFDEGESNKQFPYAAYRQFIIWQYGALGQGHRVVIPSCCVWKIRTCFPDPRGHYSGFVPTRF